MRTTKIIEGSWNQGEYKYNVQVLHNGCYAGVGRFCRTLEEAQNYIQSVMEES